jgi:hypothetical protein
MQIVWRGKLCRSQPLMLPCLRRKVIDLINLKSAGERWLAKCKGI